MPVRDKELTYNPKLAAMRERHAASGRMVRGDIVVVAPSRGVELRGMLVDQIDTQHYGIWYDVIVCGRVRRFDAERVSR